MLKNGISNVVIGQNSKSGINSGFFEKEDILSKDGTMRGGARIGAGRPPKPLEEKILDGQVRQDDKSLPDFEPVMNIEGVETPPVDEYMLKQQRDGKPLGADEILKKIYKWVKSLGCEKKINLNLLEQYSMDRARWIQCQNAISEYGMLGKHPTTGQAQQSPFVDMLLKFEKAMNQSYYLIDREVKEVCVSGYVEFNPDDAKFVELLD